MDSNETKIPRHIAIIMDGNRRWAKNKNLPRIEGHRNGALALEKIINQAGKRGVKILTVYAFSSENRNRDPKEIKDLVILLRYFIRKKRKKLNKEGASIQILGDISFFSKELQKEIQDTVNFLKNNKRIHINIALNYGGREEIVRAAKNLIKDNIEIDNIDDHKFSEYLYTSGQADPDLVIRTGGVIRLSNFLPWQSTYSELYFSDKLWPDFNEDELDGAIEEYSWRQRRFGK